MHIAFQYGHIDGSYELTRDKHVLSISSNIFAWQGRIVFSHEDDAINVGKAIEDYPILCKYLVWQKTPEDIVKGRFI